MNKKIKICFVIDSLNIGGAGILTMEVLKLLPESEFDMTVFSLYGSNNIVTIQNEIPVYVKFRNLHIEKISTLKRLFFLKEIFEHFDVVHSCMEMSNFYCSLIRNISSKVRHVCTIHGADGVFIEDEILQQAIKKSWSWKYVYMIKQLTTYLFKKTDLFIAVCNDTKEFLIHKRKIPSSKIEVIYHGRNYERIEKESNSINVQDFRNSLKLPPESFVIGFVGRLSHGKGLEGLVDVFNSLAKIKMNIHFLIVGDGDLKGAMMDSTERSGNSKMYTFTGMIENPWYYYKIMDLLVLPSSSESTALVLQEAMYNKVVTISFAVGGIPEVITNEIDGFTVRKSDFNALQDKISEIYEDKFSLDEIRKNGFLKIAQSFNLVLNVKRIEGLLRNLARRN